MSNIINIILLHCKMHVIIKQRVSFLMLYMKCDFKIVIRLKVEEETENY